MSKAGGVLAIPVVEVGGAAIAIGSIVAALLILIVAIGVAWAVRRLVRRAQTSLGETRAHAVFIGGQVLRYLIVFVGIAVAISALGVDLSALSLFAGALGVGIGIGLQDVVRNFVCGIILLFDRSIEVGDYVELDRGTQGLVTGIGPRATSLVTNDNVHILVPNADIMNGRLINWTRNRMTRRVHVPFRVALGTDKEKVKMAALEAARSVPFTLPDMDRQSAQVWLVGYGESGLDFELVVWPTLAAVKRPGNMKAAYLWAIDDALQAHGIEVPLPQRDLRLRSLFDHEGEDGIAVLRSGETRRAGGQGDVSRQASGNDAARDIEQGMRDGDA